MPHKRWNLQKWRLKSAKQIYKGFSAADKKIFSTAGFDLNYIHIYIYIYIYISVGQYLLYENHRNADQIRNTGEKLIKNHQIFKDFIDIATHLRSDNDIYI